MSTNSPNQRQTPSLDPGWILICAVFALLFAIIAFPWIVLGFVAQRLLSQRLHWRLSFLIWFILLFVCAFLLYISYQHGLRATMNQEITDYIAAAKHFQLDLTRWPLGNLWADTWPVWLGTVPALGIAGFAAEVYVNANTHPNTARTLRKQENQREKRVQRLQRRAQKRAGLLARLPSTVNDTMLIGIAIEDDNLDGGA